MKSEGSGRQASRKRSAVDEIVDELRERALSLREDDYLGTEETLTSHFQTTAPTLRQAARRLEHEQVIKVKRGVQGGYFVDRPKIETITRVAATYLRGNRDNKESLFEAGELILALTPFMVELILQNDDIEELHEFTKPKSANPTFEIFQEEEIRFSILLQKLTNNPALQFVLSIFYQVGLTAHFDRPPGGVALISEIQALRVELAKALLSRDKAAALDAALKHRRRIHSGTAASQGWPR
jgi:DNA-binding FadR family transcriptional regulator